MPRSLLLLVLPLLAAASSAQVGLERPFPTHTPEAGYLPGSEVAYFVLANPAPAPGARFGSDVCILDFDGDGHRDLAVGVPGEPGAGYAGRVDVFRGPLLTHGWTLTPKASQPDDLFGYALAAGDLDGDGDEELAVGSPGWDAGVASERVGRVVVFAHRGAAGPVQLAELRRSVDFPGARLGSDVVVADVLGGPELEVAAGAPFSVVSPSQFRAGEVILFQPKGGLWTETRWANPQPNSNHDEFGNRLAAVDWDGDGKMDLAVSAIFNWVHPSNPCVLPCVENAGQTFVVLHQTEGAPPVLAARLDNPFAGDEIQTSICISERYGMHLVAGDVDGDGFGEVFVGANRDDVGGVCEAGRGSLFSGALAGPLIGGPHPAASFTRPAPKQEDLAAYRVMLADLVGGPGLDPMIFSLSALRPHRILVWDGDTPLAFGPTAPDAGSPDLAVTALGGHGGHFCGGLFAGNLDQQGRDELVMGDYDFGPAGMPALVRTGRVVVTFWP